MLLQELSRSRLLDAFREMERIQGQFNRLFEGYTAWRSATEFPPLNVWVSEDSAVITAELPGVASEDIDVSVVNNTLTIRGSRQPEQINEDETLHRRERSFGQFSRSIQLPFRVDSERVEAKFKRGILQLTLPRAEQDKPRKITVSAA
jgi:HSP20 family protein